jgi:hypothetical protein
MIKLVNILKEIRVLGGGTSKVFIGVTSTGESTELYKLDPFPIIINQKDALKNSLGFRNALTLVLNEAYGDSISQSSLEEFIDSGITITFLGNFSSPLSKAYVYPDPEGGVAIVDSLDKFGDDYQDEQNWGVFEWKEITPIPTIKEITVRVLGDKINAYFKPDPYTPTGYDLYGGIKPENNPIIRDFLKDYKAKNEFSKEIKELTAVIPRTVKAGLGIRISDWIFGWGGRHDVRDDLMEFLKKRGIQAFSGMHDGELTVWIPKENTNIIDQD